MDIRFAPHNLHLENPVLFNAQDPQLRHLQKLPFVFRSKLIQQLPRETPGIYSLGGGRQIGKTTLLKQWMASLLQQGISAQNIYFMTGELIDDQHVLLRLLQNCIETMPAVSLSYLLIDEITYIRDWDKALKYAADVGWLEKVVLIITGSDLSLMLEARLRFPGRRGKEDQVDFHLYPLSFREWVFLKNRLEPNFNTHDLEETEKKAFLKQLYVDLDSYLIHGGFLTGINEYYTKNIISTATLMTYSDWIRGDTQKRGRQEHYLIEVLGAICKRYGSQISWNALARDLSIDHPKTVADYVALLATFDAVVILSAVLEDKKIAAPKKPKKIYFQDPFIFHAIWAWLHQTKDPFSTQIIPFLTNQESQGTLIEGIIISHFNRLYPTYYIKAEGEVDVVYLKDRSLWPIEVKWTHQIRSKDLKQIQKYENGCVWGKSPIFKLDDPIPYWPLPWKLFELE